MRRSACVLWLGLTLTAAVTVATPAHARSAHVKKKGGHGFLIFSLVLLAVVGGTGGVLYWRFKRENPDGSFSQFGGHLKEVATGVKSKAEKAAHEALDEKLGPVKKVEKAEKVAVTDKAVQAGKAAPAPAKAAVVAMPAVAKTYPPVNGIGIRDFARINAARNKAFAFDEAALAPILAPYKVTHAQFVEAEQVWQTRMADASDNDLLRWVNDEFNQESAAAMSAA